MAKSYITLDTRIDAFKDEFNNLVNKVGDLSSLTTSASGDSDLVQAINEHSAELGTITAGAMGTTASTVSTAIAELDAEADSDRSNFANNIRTIMLDPAGTGTSREVTASANNSTNETTFITFVDGATGSQGIETDTGLTYNPSSGNLTIGGELAAATLDISGNIDIDGTTNLDAVDIDGAVDMASTLGVTGVVTANAGVVVDNITIDGTEIDLSSGDLTIDVAGDINIDAGGAEINLKDDGTTVGHISMASSNLEIKSSVSDKDMIFKGNDGGSEITALTLDMSAGGNATFNDKIIAAELDISGNVDIDGTLETDAFSINGTSVTSTATELNIMDGGTSATSTTLADADRVVVNDAGTMKQVALTDFETYMETSLDTLANVTTVGALNAGSITSGFGNIDVGSSSITTTGAISGGSVTVGDAALNEAELEILDGASLSTDELNILDGALITTTELNVLNGSDPGNASNAAITVADADAVIMNDGGTMRQVDISLLKSYFGFQVVGGTAITSLDIDGGADINAALADGDLLIVDDGAAGANRKVAMSRIKTYVEDAAGEVPIANLDIDGGTDIGAAIVDADLFIVDDGAGGTNRKTAASRLLTYAMAGTLTEAAQTNITSVGTLTALTVDDITINGSTISDGGDLTVDVAGDIILDAGGADITLKDDGTQIGNISLASSNLLFSSAVSDKDIIFSGNDGGIPVIALQLNMSDAGAATFNSTVTAPTFVGAVTGNATTATTLANPRGFSITGDVTASAINFNGSGDVALDTSLANNVVVTAKILDANVTTAKIADANVTTAKIAADAITGAKIADDAVAVEHIAANAIFSSQIASLQVTSSKLANNAVTATKINADAVSGSKIADESINSEHYVDGSIDHEHLSADCVDKDNLATLRTLTINDSAGTAQFIMYGAGA